MNTQPGYECYCKQGFYYDGNLLECVGEHTAAAGGPGEAATPTQACSRHHPFFLQMWMSAWMSPTAGTECVRTHAAATAAHARRPQSTALRSASV